MVVNNTTAFAIGDLDDMVLAFVPIILLLSIVMWVISTFKKSF